MFNEESMLVKSWVRLIESGTYSIHDVPELFNLKETVATALAYTE